jgi:hypothetical protein
MIYKTCCVEGQRVSLMDWIRVDLTTKGKVNTVEFVLGIGMEGH